MGAIISNCGHYRYWLERECGLPFEGGKVYAYFGINPSTADAMTDDATVRKWHGFTLRNGGHRFIVGNVFSYRATDVRELARVDQPCGPDHEVHLQAIIEAADVLVPCWGNSNKVPKSLRGSIRSTFDLLLASGKPVMHFGVTDSGDPKHPLMLPYETLLVPWSAAA